MMHKILASTILLILFVFSAFIANASERARTSLEPETIIPLADTYVDAFSVDSNYGNRDYLEVSDYANGFSVIALMFDISKVSYNFNASSEVKLRLYCFNFTSPHIVGVHWCANNTWNEENLTFVSFSGFFRTSSESAVGVTSIDFWYEWKVTNIVRKAMEENYENITLTLEVENTLGGTALSRFASKDQTTQEMREYSPQLVFTYLEPEADSRDIIIEVALGLTATVVIAFLVYKFSKRHMRKKPKRAPKKFGKIKERTLMHLLCEWRNRQPLSRQLEPDLYKRTNVS